MNDNQETEKDKHPLVHVRLTPRAYELFEMWRTEQGRSRANAASYIIENWIITENEHMEEIA